jgi:putative ABC transport system ATP-binding protein
MNIINIKNLKKSYRVGKKTVQALNGVSLEIKKGGFLVIMGRSGSGKSTLLNLIGCIDRPTSGSIFLKGVDVTKISNRDMPLIRRKEIGFIFQHFHLLHHLTALENVKLPLKYARIPRKKSTRQATELLEAVEMGHRINHRPKELSGGEQQRVAIARALVNHPAIVLADEPTGDLDTQTAGNILEIMKNLNASFGQTFLLATHDNLVAKHAQRIIHLLDGKIESDTKSIQP